MNRSAERVYCVDLAKDKFQVNGYSRDGIRLRQKSLKRSQFDKFFSVQCSAGTRVVMEACGSSHYWARQLSSRGYEVKLVPPQFVAKQRIGNKNDGNDADGIHAVDRDARVRPVPVKTLEQQDLSAAHRLRDLWVRQRTASINQMRGLLAERGCVAARGERGVEALLKRLDQTVQGEITPALVELLRELKGQIADLDARIAGSDRHLAQVAREHPVALQVDSIRGVGPVIATAVVAKFGKDVSRFADARQFAASMGVTPAEHASGQKQYLGSITKRGDPYLRRLLVQGAQSVVRHSGRNDDPISQIARRLLERKPRNAVVVAIANRLARIIYAVIKHGTPYRYGPAAAHA